MFTSSWKGESSSWAAWIFPIHGDFSGTPTPMCSRMRWPTRFWAAFAEGISASCSDFVRDLGYEILDVDSVIAAQAPKLSPYRDQMRENLARAMGISPENVGVKATTTEHLGFEGREEGISATAVALLVRCTD